MMYRVLFAILIVTAIFSLVETAEAGDRPCRPWVTGSLHYDVTDSDGNPRNNPNETLYPGDVVRYVFDYGFRGTCYAQKVHPVQSFGAVQSIGTAPTGIVQALIVQTNDCHGGGSRGAYGYGGDDSWVRGDIRTDCGSLKMKVTAKERHCYRTSEGTRCIYIPRSATDTIYPKTTPPVVEINLYEHVLKDVYGYNATNKDWTNYPWDPIAIEHIADFEYVDERSGTIRFVYERTFEPLVEEGGYECDKPCTKQLEVTDGTPLSATGIGFVPYEKESSNGGGMYAYTAPTLNHSGNHMIRYDVTILNEGAMINTHTNQTEQLVVDYSPVFSHYEFPVLADLKKYAYDDRQGMVILYNGSIGTGPDDEYKLHPDRRSRINAFYANTTLWSEYVGISPVGIDPVLLQWDSIHHVNGTDPDGWLSTGKGHAMFIHDSYGVLYLDQKIADIVKRQENIDLWRYNVTTYNEIASDRWAGHESYRNWNYTYQYPHTPFATWYHVTTYLADGTPADSTRLALYSKVFEPVHSIPETLENDSKVILYVDDYMYHKTIHDTGDPHFATAVRDAVYLIHNTDYGTGSISLWFVKPAIEFQYGYLPYDILDLSRYLALDLDTQVETIVTADDIDVNRIFKLDLEYDYTETFMIQNDVVIPEVVRRNNSLGATNIVDISVPRHFGDIYRIYVGDVPVDITSECINTCSIVTSLSGNVTVQNIWGVNSSDNVILNETAQIIPPDVEQTYRAVKDYIIMSAIAGLVMYIVYKALKFAYARSMET